MAEVQVKSMKCITKAGALYPCSVLNRLAPVCSLLQAARSKAKTITENITALI